ncbi:hypothetical protein, partial [Vibrio cholerae]|uniref:hypothetical protein n=1 Tax=Vibrio cholerae TaxID=666 RepID=UPI00226DAEE7
EFQAKLFLACRKSLSKINIAVTKAEIEIMESPSLRTGEYSLLNNDFSWAYLEIHSVSVGAGKTNMISHHAKGCKKSMNMP